MHFSVSFHCLDTFFQYLFSMSVSFQYHFRIFSVSEFFIGLGNVDVDWIYGNKISFKGRIAQLEKGSHLVRLHRRKSSLRLIWSLEVVRRLSIGV